MNCTHSAVVSFSLRECCVPAISATSSTMPYIGGSRHNSTRGRWVLHKLEHTYTHSGNSLHVQYCGGGCSYIQKFLWLFCVDTCVHAYTCTCIYNVHVPYMYTYTCTCITVHLHVHVHNKYPNETAIKYMYVCAPVFQPCVDHHLRGSLLSESLSQVSNALLHLLYLSLSLSSGKRITVLHECWMQDTPTSHCVIW